MEFKGTIAFFILSCIFCFSGCKTTTIDSVISKCPMYFQQNIGKGIICRPLPDPPASTLLSQPYGYCDYAPLDNFPYYVLDRTFLERLTTFGVSTRFLIRHEAFHSFQFNIEEKKDGEWERFQTDMQYNDMEGLANMFAGYKQNQAMTFLLEGGYRNESR